MRPVILYDGVCNLCNGAVNLALDIDAREAFRFAALQSNAGREMLRSVGRKADDISSIVLVEVTSQGEPAGHIKSEAVLRIASGMGGPWSLLGAMGLLFPLPVRDAVYDFVAENRYNVLGKREVCRLSDAGLEDRFLKD